LDEAGVVAFVVALVVALVVVDFTTVLEAVEQSKPTEWIPMEQLDLPTPLPAV